VGPTRATRFTGGKDHDHAMERLIIVDAAAAFLGYWGTTMTTRRSAVGITGHPSPSQQYVAQLRLRK
jgi:hypothetical protein